MSKKHSGGSYFQMSVSRPDGCKRTLIAELTINDWDDASHVAHVLRVCAQGMISQLSKFSKEVVT